MVAVLKFEANQAKAFFFHGPKVRRHVDQLKTRGLKRCGAVTRTIARRSLRYSQSASKPGQPPKVHGSDSMLKEFIYFVFDADRFACVVGPARTNAARDLPVGDTVPGVLEHGGTIYFERRVFFDRSESSNRVRRRIVEAVTRRLEPRPFMEPALRTAQERYPKLFAEGGFGNG